MSDKIEFEARLTFAAHRGCGSVISTWDHAPGQHQVLSGLHGGRYRVTLEPIEPELKPCPFCGASGAYLGILHQPTHRVWCKRCGVTTEMVGEMTRADAIAAWNRRTP